ncbi:MAG TPA: TonB-dependent receptor plug domain-containing protein [Chthoniobacterales bacterium]|jgi:outer membrane receptor protein involved in Fe transport
MNLPRSCVRLVPVIISVAARLAGAQEVETQRAATSAATGIAEEERVIVTGSHIPTAEEVGPNPVLAINRDLIEKSGERTAEELIRNTTVAGPNGVPTSNNGNGNTPGASSVSLRGFDPSDTLVLIDGRRIAPFPVGTGNGAQTFVDLNSIPRAAIGSIEILKDGASSTYGADAVAGVVNIKLRQDYRGAETNIEYGNTLDKDSGEFAASLLFGLGDDKTSITGVLNFYHRNSIFNRDRGYSSTTAFPSTFASPINLALDRNVVIAAGVSPGLVPPNNPRLGIIYGHAPFFTNGQAPASDFTYTRNPVVTFNFNAFSEALPDSERYGGFWNASHKICGDQIVLYGDVFYQNVRTQYELAPTPTGFFDTPGNVILAIPPQAPGPVLGGPTYQHTGVPIGAFNPFNPFQQIISGFTRARTIEFGNRLRDNDTQAFFSTLGLKGDKLFDGNWGYDAGFRYSEIQNTSDDKLVSASRFNRILNAADPIFDPTATQFIGTTIPYNPFGDYRRPIAANSLPIDFAIIHPKSIDLSKLSTLDLNVYTTSLFKLPAGGVGLAFGGQFRRETLEQGPDEASISGDILGTGPGNFTHAGRKTYAMYAETSLPVFGPTSSLPGFHALDFTAAARFEEFRNNDTNVVVPKVGVRWQPIDESLTLRATWGEGFHEASLIESFGSPFFGFTNPFIFFGTFDPVTHTRFGEVPFTVRSNPNLQPEDSRSFSGGIVYTPKFVEGLTISIDIFDIESLGRVIIPDIQNVVNRSAIPGQSLPLEKVNRDANGEITSIELAYQNGGSQKARGADFALQYQIQTRFGTFTSLTQATYLDSFQFAQVPGEAELELRSSAPIGGAGSDEGYLKWKTNSRLDWAWHGIDLLATVHYLDGFHEIARRGPQFPEGKQEHYVKQTWFFDVQASYNLIFAAPVETQPVPGVSTDAKEAGSAKSAAEPAVAQTASYGLPCWKSLLNNTRITLGCNNVFGHDPPDAHATANYPDFLYDSTGRFVYVSLTKKF